MVQLGMAAIVVMTSVRAWGESSLHLVARAPRREGKGGRGRGGWVFL